MKCFRVMSMAALAASMHVAALGHASAMPLAQPTLAVPSASSNIVKVHGCGPHHLPCYGPHYHKRKYVVRKRSGISPGGAAAIGAFGFIAGAMIASGAKAQPKVVYRTAPRPWTPAWYAYCARKFRSFEPATGLYTTYKGYKRQCW